MLVMNEDVKKSGERFVVCRVLVSPWVPGI